MDYQERKELYRKIQLQERIAGALFIIMFTSLLILGMLISVSSQPEVASTPKPTVTVWITPIPTPKVTVTKAESPKPIPQVTVTKTATPEPSPQVTVTKTATPTPTATEPTPQKTQYSSPTCMPFGYNFYCIN